MDASATEPDLSTTLSGANAPYIEDLYATYQRDPAAVDARWRAFFDALGAPDGKAAPGTSSGAIEKQAAVSRLMQSMGNRGHLVAKIDPLGLMERPRPRVIDPAYVGLTDADLDTEFYTGSRNAWMPRHAPLREILARLEQVYCGTIGAEFAHISDTEERLWLQDEFQLGRMQQAFGAEERREILRQLTAAEGLERFLHTRFVGQKRFSLEGGDALIALLDDLVQQSGRSGVEEAVLGDGPPRPPQRARQRARQVAGGPVLGVRRAGRRRAGDRATSSITRVTRRTCAHQAATSTWCWPSIPRTSRS